MNPEGGLLLNGDVSTPLYESKEGAWNVNVWKVKVNGVQDFCKRTATLQWLIKLRSRWQASVKMPILDSHVFAWHCFPRKIGRKDGLLLVLDTISFRPRPGPCLPLATYMRTMDANLIIYPGQRADTKQIQISVANPEKKCGTLVRNQISHLCITTPGHSQHRLGCQQLN